MCKILPLLALFLSSGLVWGQGVNTSLIKDRAREVSGKQQQPIPPRPGATAPAAARPGVNTAQQQSLTKLSGAIASVKIRSEATPELKERLTTDLKGARLGATHASDESVGKLGDLLATVLVGRKLTAPQQTQLAGSLGLLLSGSGATPAMVNAAAVNVRDLLTSTGVPAEQLLPILKELQTIAAGIQPVAAK